MYSLENSRPLPFQKHFHEKHSLVSDILDVKREDNSYDFACPVQTCERRFITQDRLKLHMAKHRNPCQDCNATFVTRTALSVRDHPSIITRVWEEKSETIYIFRTYFARGSLHQGESGKTFSPKKSNNLDFLSRDRESRVLLAYGNPNLSLISRQIFEKPSSTVCIVKSVKNSLSRASQIIRINDTNQINCGSIDLCKDGQSIWINRRSITKTRGQIDLIDPLLI